MIYTVNMKNMRLFYSYICRLKISYSIQKQKVYLKRVYEYSLIKQIKFILGWAVPLGSEAILFSINIDDIH